MANVLIVYATRHGQTERIARRMAATLEGHQHQVQLLDAAHVPRSFDVNPFEVALVGGPMYAGRYPAAIVRFARARREFLQRTASAFFSVNLAVASRTSDGRAETLPCVEKLIQQTGWRPARVELIAGALSYTKYNFLMRFFMRRIARKAGGDTDTSRDHEYTDWDAVERFAIEVVGTIEGAQAASPDRALREPASARNHGTDSQRPAPGL